MKRVSSTPPPLLHLSFLTSNSLSFSYVAEIPLFHVLNARITFDNVNKCRTEEDANPTPEATPTSPGEEEEEEEEEAAGRATLTTTC